MNITFQTLNAVYRPSVPAQNKQKPRPETIKGDYDTVNISHVTSSLEDEESFARILAKRTSSQLNEGASPERFQELSRRISDGSYQPNAQRIAGRLLGLN